MRVECAPRACTSWSTAAAALIWPVCEFLAAGCWAAAQSSTGVTLIRRCAGLPMQHELLSTTARALALLQHPSRFTCPHTLLQRRCAFFVHRQDLQLPPVFRAQVGSEATDRILLVDNAIAVRKIRPGADCFAALDVLPVAPLRERVLMGPAVGGSRALLLLPTAGPASPYHGLSRCTRTRCKGAFSARARAISA